MALGTDPKIVKWNGPEVVEALRDYVAKGLEGGMKGVEEVARSSMKGGGPAPAGGPPGRVTNRLADSITSKVQREGGDIVGVLAAGEAWWGRLLETGTNRMAARPWARPAVFGSAALIIQHVRQGG